MKNILLALLIFCVLLLFFFSKDVVAGSEYLSTLVDNGNYLLDHGRYGEAITYYNKALRNDPDNFDALLGKGYALDQLQKYDEAIPYLDKALKIYPHNFYAIHSSVDALLNNGYALIRLQKYDEAIPYLDKALKIDANNIDALLGKGYALDQLQKYDEAIPYLDKSLKIDANNIDALYDKAVALEGLGRHKEALSYYDKVLKIDPKFALPTVIQPLQKEMKKQKDQELQYQSNNTESNMKTKPLAATIKGQTINKDFTDSKGNLYHWEMPSTTYENIVQKTIPVKYLHLVLPDGKRVTELNYTLFVEPSFTKVIDKVYDNAGSDKQFIHEVWYIASQVTTYSFDITGNNLWPLETFTRGYGDCKDTSILIASMIRSSEHTKNWHVQLVYLDAYNPDNPQSLNHMIVKVVTPDGTRYIIESTAKTESEFHGWDGIEVVGWAYDV